MILRRRSLRKRLIRGRGLIFEILMTKTNRIHRRIYLPRNKDLQSEVPTEAHPSSYSIGPWSTKIYPNPHRQHYRWNGMRSDIAHFHVDRLERNAKSQEGTLNPLEVPKRKWELRSRPTPSRAERNHDSIRVIIHRLTKTAHFMLVPGLRISTND